MERILKYKNYKAPYIDMLIESAQAYPIVKYNSCQNELMILIKEISKLKIQGYDELRSIWIEADRGKIKDFGSYKEYLEEEQVSNYEAFVELWECYYPDEKKWYHFSVSSYMGQYYLFIDSKLTFHIKGEEETVEDADCYNTELSVWLKEKVIETISKIESDLQNYNKYISENLPYKKRYGKIKRSAFWKIFPYEGRTFKKAFPPESIDILKNIVKQSAKDESGLKINKMTSGDFFRFCEIGYDANNYFKGKKAKLTPREKYLDRADGRDCELRKIDENSIEEFEHWYKNKSHCGGHPWEVCRGGNSTHISLYVSEIENGWIVSLAGSSSVRVVETVKIAIALYEHDIPFKLWDAEEILRMITGTDYIGIVPETVFPRYCHGLFPKNDRIIDFMNLGFEKADKIIENASWYPVEEVELGK
ncbi:MAG: hypothetical protein FJW68_10540 [Actinobacteria bacterium]|nr:hypothetical protein [Actinomycetota bacterium]